MRLFVAFALLYVLADHGRPFTDDVFQFEQIETLVDTGEFVMSPARDMQALGGAGAFMRPGVDGRLYLTLPPGLALAGAPLGWIGHVLEWPRPEPPFPVAHQPDAAVAFWSGLLAPLAGAVLVSTMFLLVRAVSGSTRKGLQAALVLGLATNLWFYATTFWPQVLAAMCLFGAAALVLRGNDGRWRFALAGGLLSYAVVTRFELALVAPWVVGLAYALGKARLRAVVGVAIPVLVALVAILAWNELRFGDAFETRSIHQGTNSFRVERIPSGVVALLVAPEQGLVLYVPSIVVGLVGLQRSWRRDRALVVCVVGLSLTLLALYASFVFAETPPPIAWGSRFLFPVVPLLVLSAFIGREDPLRPWWARAVVAASVVSGVAGVVQRARLGPPTWWIDDGTRTWVAIGMAAVLVALAVDLARPSWRQRVSDTEAAM